MLDDFVRMRLFRKQAAEFQWLADNASVPSVQRRYRVIARHYSELAGREEQADKTRMARRLEQLRLKRQEAAAQAESVARRFVIVSTASREPGFDAISEGFEVRRLEPLQPSASPCRF